MKIAVLGHPNSWYLRDLQRAKQERHEQLELSAVAFTQISTCVEPANNASVFLSNTHDLATYDAVLVRTMPPGSLEQVIFRMNALAMLQYSNDGPSQFIPPIVLNSPRAIEIAVDKYLSLALLRQNNISVPRTHICQQADAALHAYEQLGPDVVVKPLFGGEGRGITRVSDPALALRAFKMIEQLGGVIYQQEFIAHEGFDIRILVIGDNTFGIRRVNPDDWRTNLSLGARAEPFDASSELVQLARRAANVVQAKIAGVDILIAPDGTPTVLEVNAVPGWKGLAAATGKDIAQEILTFTIAQIADHRRKS
ncbi:MAG: RimK family alpha-L-glutamate ligase [Planctomycetaceae bacterium]|jgi:ribosomal protein S6--L-glutamate ligase|nr:RimK family alpha-L-glutamate ligase [Planctomycetaceae bacterium]MBT4013655.1 RimK family alpha-L-glutamate ligase [Planctomycetaceae bacterium]MBT4846703.1 RimK family alpha-L-glutamate ligase [Planctomycetaceae bacterium]MBT5126077.1 RimK family alpha-L-glutamate ligase [Planctomycetaceae bacterium]MBT5598039.1 RimK family alpha-L-glutamate ligase [Planctomycetaceae bacterium]